MTTRQDYTGKAVEQLHASLEEKRNGQTQKLDPKQLIKQEINHIFFEGMNNFLLSSYTPAKGDAKEKVSYYRQEGQPTDEQLSAHFSGEPGSKVLAAYTIREGNVVRWLCWDVDSTDLDKAKNIAEDVHEKLGGVPHAIEPSGGKGYHVWVFLSEDIDAGFAHIVGKTMRDVTGVASSGDPHIEVYPKQKSAQETGNGVKVPLCHHPNPNKGKSYFVDPSDDWTITPPLPELKKRATKAQLEQLLEQLQEQEKEPKTPEEAMDDMVKLLAPYWVDQQRHDLALCLSGTLLTVGWSKAKVDELITSLVEVAGGDLNNVLGCVDSTMKKLIDGKQISGLEALGEIIPASALRAILALAGANVANSIVSILDRIRIKKGPPQFVKVREVTATVLSYLREQGRFVMTPEPENKKFWYEHSTHKLFSCALPEWEGVLYRTGMNLKESFYSQVNFALDKEIELVADRMQVHHKSYWDGKVLWINFGGVEVYRLDGQTITLTYNGAEDVLFDSFEHITAFDGLNLLEIPKTSPWTLLTQNINFTKKDKVTAAEAEQQEHMLRALIIAMNFLEAHPTKPLSLFLGPRGSGKTSACRRILRFFSGMDAEVLSLVADKPDSMRVSLENRRYLPFDNVEECKAKWFPAELSKLATGISIELRTLFKTNESYIIRPSAFISLSAIEIPDIFSGSGGEAVASRLLPFQTERLNKPVSEQFLQEQLEKNHSAMWAGMLEILNLCVASLNAHVSDRGREAEIRLADFDNFCYRLRDVPEEYLSYTLIGQGIRSLSAKQTEAMNSNSPFIKALQTWLDGFKEARLYDPNLDPAKLHTATTLNNILKPIAVSLGLEDQWRWKTGQQLSKHMEALEGLLQRTYGMEVEKVASGEGKDADGNPRTRKEYKFKPV